MALVFYESEVATDGPDMRPVKDGLFQVYELDDTSRRQPLPLYNVRNVRISALETNSWSILPDVQVDSPNDTHIFRSGNFEWRRTSSDRLRRIAEESRDSAEKSSERAEKAAAEVARVVRDIDAPTDIAVDRGIQRANVPATVMQVLARDSTVVAAAAEAVGASLADAGVMRGHRSIPIQLMGSAWRQTTEDGKALPLGYKPNGHLDDFATKIWREDVLRAVDVPAHPVYARVLVTEDNRLLFGIRWDGTVEIPGLAGGGDRGTTAPTPIPQFYNEAPYSPGSDIWPGRADPSAWTMWSSSSGAGIASEMHATAPAYGATYYDHGKGGERSTHIAARLGSVPALLTFPDNLIPASGAAQVSCAQLLGNNSLRNFSGDITAKSGAVIRGTLAYSSTSPTSLVFTRAVAGEKEPVDPEVPLIPDAGNARRGDTTFLWMGKNNAFEPDRVIRETDASFEFLTPLVKRCIVLGHFVNTTLPASDSSRANIRRINEAHAARFGDAFLDVGTYLTGPQVWEDTGITPTEDDLREQRIGNKPPSLSSDNGHMNAAGYRAVRRLLTQRIERLGWYTPAQA